MSGYCFFCDQPGEVGAANCSLCLRPLTDVGPPPPEAPAARPIELPNLYPIVAEVKSEAPAPERDSRAARKAAVAGAAVFLMVTSLVALTHRRQPVLPPGSSSSAPSTVAATVPPPFTGRGSGVVVLATARGLTQFDLASQRTEQWDRGPLCDLAASPDRTLLAGRGANGHLLVVTPNAFIDLGAADAFAWAPDSARLFVARGAFLFVTDALGRDEARLTPRLRRVGGQHLLAWLPGAVVVDDVVFTPGALGLVEGEGPSAPATAARLPGEYLGGRADGSLVASRAAASVYLSPTNDLLSPVPARPRELAGLPAVGGATFSSSGDLLAFVSPYDGAAHLWVTEVATGRQVLVADLPGAVQAYATSSPSFSGDGRLVFLPGPGGVLVWDLQRKEGATILAGTVEEPAGCRWSGWMQARPVDPRPAPPPTEWVRPPEPGPRPVTTLAGPGTPIVVSSPRALSTDGHGTLYVTENAKNVLSMSPQGSELVLRAVEATAVITGLAATGDGRLYVAEGARVRELRSDGTVSEVLGPRDGLRFVSAVAVGQEGTLYAADAGTLWRRAPDGSITRNRLDLPGPASALAIRPDGVVYAVSNDGLFRLEAEGGVTRVRTPPPIALAIAGRDLVMVGNYGLSTLGPDDRPRGSLPPLDGPFVNSVTPAGLGLDSPDGLAIDSDGTVYVSDATQGRIVRIAP